MAELLGAKPRKPITNWVGASDVRNLFDIAGFETITESRRILLPKHVPGSPWPQTDSWGASFPSTISA